jgi:phage terminase small subunit
MGGQGSGGERPGAGRKPKTALEKTLSGTADRSEREFVINPPPIIPVARPLDLAGAEQETWDELSPLALTERTLTPSTQTAFRHLCEAIVLRREMANAIAIDGLTIDTPLGLKAHPLLTQYRGLTQRVEAGMLRFRLSPIGKPLIEAPTKKNDGDGFDEFEGDTRDDDDDEHVS